MQTGGQFLLRRHATSEHISQFPTRFNQENFVSRHADWHVYGRRFVERTGGRVACPLLPLDPLPVYVFCCFSECVSTRNIAIAPAMFTAKLACRADGFTGFPPRPWESLNRLRSVPIPFTTRI